MIKQLKEFQEADEIKTSPLAHELLRTKLLADLLGNENEMIQYYMGKNLARMYPCASIEDLGKFFSAIGWGNLQMINEKKKERQFELSGSIIQARFSYDTPYLYKMEAGWIAEQLNQLTGEAWECTYKENKRKAIIHFYAAY